MGSHYSHLSLEERRKLAKWLEAKMPLPKIAVQGSPHPCAVFAPYPAVPKKQTPAPAFPARPTRVRPKAIATQGSKKYRTGDPEAICLGIVRDSHA